MNTSTRFPRGVQLLRKRLSFNRLRLASLLIALLALGAAGCGSDSPTNSGEPAFEPTIETWAGRQSNGGYDGDGNAPLATAFYWPMDLLITSSGDYYVADWNNHRIRHYRDGGVFETVIGNLIPGDGPLNQADLSPPGAPGTDCFLNHPVQMVELNTGKLLLTAWHNHKLRHYDPDTGLVYILAGSGPGYEGDGGPARDAKMNQPSYTLQAPDGSLFFIDMRNHCIRKIDPAGMISTVAGTGVAGWNGDDHAPLATQFYFPDLSPGSSGDNSSPHGGALALDSQGRIYVSDTNNHRIRRIDFVAGTVETIAGIGPVSGGDGEGTFGGFSGDGGPAVDAQINWPRDLEIGPAGHKLYFCDDKNHRVRVIDLGTGSIDTFAGNGTPAFSGDGGTAKQASLNRPAGLEFSPDGKYLYIADTYNHRIRRVQMEK